MNKLEVKSHLKNILLKYGCIFDKYFTRVSFFNTYDDVKELIYLTPFISKMNRKFVVITRQIKGSWFDSIKDIDVLINFLSKNYNYNQKIYMFIFQIYIENIELEHFYLYVSSSADKLEKLSSEKFKKILLT